LGGVDATGPHLFTIHPHGSTDKLPYVTMGSGSLAAMAVFESGWKANMSVRSHPLFTSLQLDLLFVQREAALQLVKDAISAGIFNDLGSGSNVDACIITASHTEMLRNVEMPNIRVQKERQYGFRRGTTAWKTENIRSLVVSEEVTLLGTGDEMDTT
jgi:20S proteasome subunit beta 2